MRLVFQDILKDFCTRHPDARAAASRWEKLINNSSFANQHELRQCLRSADYVAPFTVFNIGGNNYRIISTIDFFRQAVFISQVMTHAEYDKWTKQYLRGKARK